jgi:cyanophycinase
LRHFVRLRLAGLSLLLLSASALLAAQAASSHGPAHGSLVLKGGVGNDPAIDAAFVALAGGPASRIVVIPTASLSDYQMPPGMLDRLGQRMRQSLGVSEVTVLHTHDRARANAESFVAPLRAANGVWFLGGFPPLLVQAYLGTKTETAIRELLDRGGVVGGESAGAMIQGAWLDTTDDEFTSDIKKLMEAHAAGGGFGLLTRAAIFPHFDTRGSADAIKESLAHPDQLAIGIDEGTALIVKGTMVEIVGRGTVNLYDGSSHGAPVVVTLRAGDRYDLATRLKGE